MRSLNWPFKWKSHSHDRFAVCVHIHPFRCISSVACIVCVRNCFGCCCCCYCSVSFFSAAPLHTHTFLQWWHIRGCIRTHFFHSLSFSLSFAFSFSLSLSVFLILYIRSHWNVETTLYSFYIVSFFIVSLNQIEIKSKRKYEKKDMNLKNPLTHISYNRDIDFEMRE